MPNMIDLLHHLAQSVAAGLLNCLVAGVAVALLAWAVTWRFKNKGSGTRFAIWLSALVVVMMVPFLDWLGRSQGLAASTVVHGSVQLPALWASYLVTVWMVGATLGLVRVGFSLFRLARLRSTCNQIDLDQLTPELRGSLAEVQTHRRVVLFSSNSVRVPAAMGYFRPIVVFPTWALEEIPTAELNAILLHELAHLRRWDDWTNLAQKVVKAVFFFHPAVWFIENRLSLEREMACDDAVLASNFSPRAYAESLVSLAEKSFLHRGVQLAQAAVSHVRQLRIRIAEILRRDRHEGAGASKPAIALTAFAALVVLCGVSRVPGLVTFADDPSIASAAINGSTALVSTESRLRPVKANFVASARQSDVTTPASSNLRPRVVRSVVSKPSVTVAQRTFGHKFAEDEVSPPPMIVLSNFAVRQNTTLPSGVLVVMQRAQFGLDGPIFWRVAVFQLTQSQQQVITGGVPRKI